MSWYEPYTAYEPVRTTTTTSTWRGWQAVNMRCFGCKHSYMSGTALMCACANRTLKRTENGDECISYKEVDA